MNRLPSLDADTVQESFYVCSFTDESGFVFAREGEGWLLWANFLGRVELFEGDSVAELRTTLQRNEVIRAFRFEWVRESRPADEFEAAWAAAVEEIFEQCEPAEANSTRVTDRLKRQLLWAFDHAGKVDADTFLTILRYERVTLTPAQLIALINELLPAAMFHVNRRQMQCTVN